MDFILCSSAVVFCLVLQVSSQPPPKPIGEWSPDRAWMYPNPLVDFTKCNRPESSGLCDVNTILTEAERNGFGKTIEEFKEFKVCEGGIIFAMAIMKHIGPDVTNYRVAAKEFEGKFRELWNLSNCSIILIASNNDNASFSDAGLAVQKLLPPNKTIEIDWDTYENYFKKGLFVEGLNATVMQYRDALTKATETPNEKENSAAKIIVGVIVCGLAVLIIVIIIVIVIKQQKKKTHKVPIKEEEYKNVPQEV